VRRAHRIPRLGRGKANRWEQTSRGHADGDEPSGLRERNKPLKGQPWTWQRGETNPQKSVTEQAVESVRNAEDGTSGRAREARPTSGLHRLTSRRGKPEPHGRRSRREHRKSQDFRCFRVSGRTMERRAPKRTATLEEAASHHSRDERTGDWKRPEDRGKSAHRQGPGMTQKVPVTSRPKLRGAPNLTGVGRS
jgi:hypothetical protein